MVGMNLAGSAGVVTGGAFGIGKSIALKLAEAGASVVIADIDEEQGAVAVSEIEGMGGAAFFMRTDVSDVGQVGQLAAEAVERYGKIDFLVNNAGILIPRLIVDPDGREEITESIFDKMIAINQKGALFCTQAVVRHMIKDNIKGVIVNMASESGLEGSEGQSVYASTKAALYSFTRSWGKELGKYGIRVVGVAPGILEKTGLRSNEYEKSLAYARGKTVQQVRDSYEKLSIPLGRVGRLDETANVVCFLISDLASYITGTVINISGGKSRV